MEKTSNNNENKFTDVERSTSKRGFFLSHYQANAGPCAMRLKSQLSRSWSDGSDEDIWLDKDNKPSEDGMKAGVAGAEYFLLILSDGIFSRWFCRLEIREALRLKKKILLT
jgi:hypothetical protein